MSDRVFVLDFISIGTGDSLGSITAFLPDSLPIPTTGSVVTWLENGYRYKVYVTAQATHHHTNGSIVIEIPAIMISASKEGLEANDGPAIS